MMSRLAPSRFVPSVTRSKQNLTESATTPESAPISRRTEVILASGSRSVTAATTPSVIASSCIFQSANSRQRITHEEVNDPGAAERRAELDDALGLGDDVPDDRRLRTGGMRAQGTKRDVGDRAFDHHHHPALAGNVHGVDAEQLGRTPDLIADRDRVLVDQDADVGRPGDLVHYRR